MGSFTCDCGFVIRDSAYPNPDSGDLIHRGGTALNDEIQSASDGFEIAEHLIGKCSAKRRPTAVAPERTRLRQSL